MSVADCQFARQGPQQIVERLSLSQRQLYAAQMLAKITKEKRRSTTVLLCKYIYLEWLC